MNQDKEMALKKKRAFDIYSSNPNISNNKLSKEVGVNPNTISKWMLTDEWINWNETNFKVINFRLRDKLSQLDNKIVDYIDNLIGGRLSPEELKGSSAVINLFKSRLEMAGYINRKAGVEITNHTNLIDQKQINNINISNMTETQLMEYITSGNVPKSFEALPPLEIKAIEMPNPIEEEKKEKPKKEKVIPKKKKNIEPEIDLDELGIKTI
jgi:hypothetical protein